MKNIVLGLALNMSWEALEPWVVSLRRSGYEGDVLLWVMPGIPKETAVALAEFNIKTQQLENLPFANPETPKNRFFPYVGRFLLIYRYLTEHPEYDNVLCSDVRDVVFMRDPFKEIWFNGYFPHGDDFLIAAGENMLHCNQAGNMAWLTKSFKEVEDFLVDKEIICSGVIAGSAKAIREIALHIYLMGRDLTATVWGVDQPVYNFLIHGPFARIATTPAPKEGWCLNLAAPAMERNFDKLIDLGAYEIFAASDESAENGFPAGMRLDTGKFAIVHQYDRVPPLAKFFREHFKK